MLRTALRSLSRNRRRTIVTGVSVLLAAFLVCSLRFLGYGMHQQMVWQTAGILSGYAQVTAYGWLESRSIDRAVDAPDELLFALRSLPGVSAIAPRIEGPALVAVNEESRFVTVTAVDPARERGLVNIHTRVIEGRYLSGAGPAQSSGAAGSAALPEAVVGFRLARLLGLGLGTELALITTQFDGSVGAARARVVGIYRTHNPELDFNRVLVQLQTGRLLFAPDATEKNLRRYTSVVLGVHTARDALRVLEKGRSKFPGPRDVQGVAPEESQSFVPVMHGWQELNPDLVAMMNLDQAGNEMWIAFLILMMAFGILNSVYMSIHERKRELGVLLAIGFRPGRLLFLVMLETLLVLVPAILFGTLLGVALGTYLEAHPIPISGAAARSFEDFGFRPVIQSVVDPGELWVALASLFVPAMLFVYMGSRRILSMDPARIIARQ